MRLVRILAFWTVLGGLAGSIVDHVAAQEGTGGPPVEADDPRAEIRALRERLETVERRLAESEAAKTDAAGTPETFVAPPAAPAAIPSWMPTEEETFVAADGSGAGVALPKAAAKPADPFSMSAKCRPVVGSSRM